MMDKAELKKIEKLLSQVTAYRISKGTIYQFTPTTICSISTTSKKATSKRKSSFIVRYSLQRAKI